MTRDIDTINEKRISKVVKNKDNKLFFKSKKFSDDKRFQIMSLGGDDIFTIITGKGRSFYKLKGEVIGKYVSLPKLK